MWRDSFFKFLFSTVLLARSAENVYYKVLQKTKIIFGWQNSFLNNESLVIANNEIILLLREQVMK